MKEKTNILNLAIENNYLLYFEHDPLNQMCSLQQTEKGIRANEFLIIE
jgi:hypothetical protein